MTVPETAPENLPANLTVKPPEEIVPELTARPVSVAAPMPDLSGADQVTELERIRKAAQFGKSIGLRVNAGHGLHEGNVIPIAAIAELSELNIGHAIVAEALFKGWQKAITDMKVLMIQGRAHS